VSPVHAMPFGAALRPGGGVCFRLWAPDARRVALRLEGPGAACEHDLEARAEGWFEVAVAEAGPGTRYRYRIDDDPLLVPDPASRFQPEGPHGPSEVVDPTAWRWADTAWRGRPWEEMVIEELHVGAFTGGGRFVDAIGALDPLAALGVTAVELMPVAEFPGDRDWGYDGTHPFAPSHVYGRPEDLRRLVEAAHARGLAVLLDVVYNHFGPEGNYLGRYASPFFTERHRTPWGAAIDFEGAKAGPVREFFLHNALFWLDEYRLDGLRLDAVHAIHDASRPDVLEELATRVHERFSGDRPVHLVLENDRNEARRLARGPGGGARFYTAQWNDDFHHALHVLVTGEQGGYYEDFAEDPMDCLGRALAEGFAWQGQPSPHRGGVPRGEASATLPPTAFVNFLQNHDQIGNRALGERLTGLAPAEALRAASAVLLLAPGIPLLFMGEEWGAPEPFPFFCDFGPDLADAVRDGRRREFAAFPAFRDPAARARIPDPCAPETFEAARLDRHRAGAPEHRARLDLHARLLSVRHREIVPRLAGTPGGTARFERLGPRSLHVAWTLGDGATLELVAHLDGEPGRGARVPARGRVLFETSPGVADDAAAGRLRPWSVAWRLIEAGGAGA
jgi:malto-oligosyltrehalose trehalohydrolase